MPGQNKSGGGARKIGKQRPHCKRYIDRMTRFTNKLKRFLKHNVAKNATQQEVDTKRREFKTIQENRSRKNV